MAFSLITLAFLALAHFIYEAIIAPTLRLKIQYELFELRDALKSLKIQYQDDLEEETFKHLKVTIRNAIVWAHTVSFSKMFEVEREFDSNQGLRQRVKYRRELLEKSSIPEVKDIAFSTSRLVQRALIINTGPVYLCFLPVFAVELCAGRLKKWSWRVKSIAFMPENDVQRIVHDHYKFKWA